MSRLGKHMLDDQIAKAQRLVKTDSYSMSVGEVTAMYERAEIDINPEFQRLFRWDVDQKSRLIESILLGIPLPSIFVFEKDDASWELIDGLQRISTLLEFMGLLKKPDGGIESPSKLVGTKYLSSLNNCVWDKKSSISGDQVAIGRTAQLAIKRARLNVEILKRPSDNLTKYDLFQRLNAGGTPANAQELRNCAIIMSNPQFHASIKEASELDYFLKVINANADQMEKQRHMEYVVRFIVHCNFDYAGDVGVEIFVNDKIIVLSGKSDGIREKKLIEDTFDLLFDSMGRDPLPRFEGGRHTGRVGLVGLEAIASGVGYNFSKIARLRDKKRFVKERITSFWGNKQVSTFFSQGLTGTTRIQRTVPFGRKWFKP